MKASSVRDQILDILSKESKPQDAILLTEKIGANKTSVYRQLQALETSGEIAGLDFGDGKKRYELANVDHHHHLICVNCRIVSEVDLQEEKLTINDKSFKVLRHSLEFFGLCSNCVKLS